MNSVNSLSANFINEGKISTKTTPKTGENAVDTSAAAKATATRSDSVTLSGQALMLSRLFGEDASTYTGRVEAKESNVTSLNRYLTTDDREMLANMYEYAQNNGIDLKHVDALAGDLGGYRKFGTATGSSGQYDLEGHARTVSQSADNQQIIDRIKASAALSQTTIDQGFIQSEMVTGGHAANYAFLERMVNVFSTQSPQGAATAGASSAAPLAAYNADANKLVTTVSDDVQLVVPEADYVSVNGVGHWRTPELAAANQKPPSANGQPDIQDLLSLLDRQTKQNNGVSQLPDKVKTIVADWLNSSTTNKSS
ncbi:hypothetical protein GTP58_13365 [Duganella sp. CY15W]|uniref:hypothetical protein n=1 Tax=Duganella sp. CY15W TaxID=2692172 RepID=UPI001367FC45|nr:hypothetical protein [Duganella sp. CY15W]MYM29313.1 hypothetical protein [Duganella sp. CY15W]